MVEKIIECLKDALIGNEPILRKLRILRYVACIIILFIAFCNSYWNLLAYVDLPCAPLLRDDYRYVLHSTGILMVAVWLLYSAFFQNIYRVISRERWMKVSYIDILIELTLTIYFLAYALNLGIEYANGLEIHIKEETVLAVVYLIYCILRKSYTLHRINFEKNKYIEYTKYCDNKGQQIPVDSKIFYKGKEHKVVKYEGIYRLLPYDEQVISSELIKLEDAASDTEGNLFLKKDRILP